MSIARVEIHHYKSIRHCDLAFRDINLLIGENGTGKSNLLDAVRYFHDSLLEERDDRECYHFQNRFSNEFSISVTFDFRHLKRISARNRSRGADVDYQDYYDWIVRRQPYETLTMRKVRGRPVHWNQDRKYRQNISNLFPMYAVDAREVNLTDWRQLWDIIGDLMKVHRAREKEIAAEISAIKDRAEYKLEERFGKLAESFDKAHVRIQPFTPKQYASTISTLIFQGNVFSAQDSGLDYMSNGTNAFNYTNLLVEILKLISEYKIKDPIVLLDEPELSLHHKLIDQLTTRILGCGTAMQFLAATHSPRLLKNMIKLERSNCEVIHVSARNGCTQAAPMTLFSRTPGDERPRVFMMDQHANAYFSRYLLSVEGASETEVFSHEYLQTLFPFLRDVDVMEGMSDDVVQKIISPRQRHFQTRCLLLMDMDKAIIKSGNGNRFKLANKYFSEQRPPQERYDYSDKRTEQLLRLKRIRALAERGRFHYWYPFFSCKDPNFIEWIHLIKDYLKERNLYVAATTTEGMLITDQNLPFFWTYCQTVPSLRAAMPALQETYDSLLKNDRLNFVRLLFNGKSDYILKLEEIGRQNPGMDRRLYELIARNRFSKTGGWISSWLDFYFCSLSIAYGGSGKGLSAFAKTLEDPDIRYEIRRVFHKDFPELYEVLEIIRQQMKTK